MAEEIRWRFDLGPEVRQRSVNIQRKTLQHKCVRYLIRPRACILTYVPEFLRIKSE